MPDLWPNMSADDLRKWARSLKSLAASKEREALTLQRRADAVLAELADRAFGGRQ